MWHLTDRMRPLFSRDPVFHDRSEGYFLVQEVVIV